MRRMLLVPVLALALVTLNGVTGPSAGAAGRARTAVVRHDPVLLVHGFDGSAASWRTMSAALRADGYRADQIDAISYDSEESNVEVAHQIARAADALRARTGAPRIDIVSHSMGAISSRYYLERLGGAARVDAWASLAGVNEGTVWAYGCYVLVPCREMVPTSSLLKSLNADFRPAGPTRYASWWSPCDEAVVPPSNAKLSGALNIETSCLGHSAIKTDPKVLGQVERFLDEKTLGT